MKFLFQNEHFVIMDKPAMVLTVPDRHQSDRPCLGLELQKELKTQIFPVHRLDYEVSGLVLFALHEVRVVRKRRNRRVSFCHCQIIRTFAA